MILYRAHLRSLSTRPWQSVASVVGIALGVAVVVAIDMVNSSARRGFEIANQALAGAATHRIVGGPAGLDEAIYRSLRVERGLRRVAPVVEGRVRIAGAEGLWYRVIGIDPFAESGFRSYGSNGALDPVDLLRVPDSVYLTSDGARQLGTRAGDALDVLSGARRLRVEVIGVLESGAGGTGALGRVIVCDIATAQAILNMRGRLSHIDLTSDSSEIGAIEASLPPVATVVTVQSSASARSRMSEAFEINLTALSLLALVIGMFLIYNTMTFSVVRRRAQIGVLRTLGVTRGEVFRGVMFEALVIGCVATAAGIVGGAVLAQGLLKIVTRTLNDLYFEVEVARATVGTVGLAKALAIGIAATLAAAGLPALEAMRAPPRGLFSRSILERQARSASRFAVAFGLVVVGAGTAVLTLSPDELLLGFLGLFLLMFGYAALVPFATMLLMAGASALARRTAGIVTRMAIGSVTAALSRTGLAVAALAVALSATVGVGVMIGSFRLSVERWLHSYLRADVYISAAAESSGVDSRLVERVRALPSVASVGMGRRVRLEEQGRLIELFALDVDRRGFAGFQFTEGDPDRAWVAFRDEAAVIVSEPFAYRRGVGVGDEITLRTVVGERSFPVQGVYRDYGSDQGVITMSRDTYLEYWQDPVISALSLYLVDGAAPEEVIDQLLAESEASAQLRIAPVGTLREASLTVFDRTFTVTTVLRVIAIVVAAVGILAALMAIQLERAREFSVLRVLGFGPVQLWKMILGETAMMGLTAGVLALPLGVATAFALVHVINRRAFGWAMDFTAEPGLLFEAIALGLGAALVAGVYPAYRLTRAAPAAGLREE